MAFTSHINLAAFSWLCLTPNLLLVATAEAQTPTGTVKFAQIESLETLPEPAAVEEDFYPIDVPVTLNNAYIGDVTTEATLSGYARLNASELKELLADRLTLTQSAVLDEFGDTFILLQALRDRGFLAIYDPSELTIKITLPREGVERLNVSGRTVENLALDNVQTPAKFSAGLGLIARPRYIHQSLNGDKGFAPLAADMRGFFSIGGFKNWSLTYDVNYQEDRGQTVQRGDITLTRDSFEKAIRFQAGDIRPSIIGFQSGVDILGLSIERNYGAIQPFRNLRPGGRSRFTLERQARVSYEVNGVTLGGQRLEAGDYDIRDFPLITGANDVRIIVDDEFGRREVGAYSTFVDSELLASDTLLFGLNAGVRQGSGGPSGRSYGNDPLALGFLETGLSDQWTIGGQFEASEAGGFVGGRAIHGFGSSVVALETGLSSFNGFDTGIVGALRYSLRPAKKASGKYNQFDAQVSYQSRDFQTLGNRGQPRGELWSANVRNNYTAGRRSYGVNASWVKSDADETIGLGATFRTPIKSISVSIGYRGEYSVTDDEFDNQVFLSLSQNFGSKGSVRARVSSNPNEAELEWRRLSTRGLGAWSGRASYLSSEVQDEFSADASYIASRGEFDIGHSTLFENGGGPIVSSVTDARIGVGLGFADGSFAVGRPVSNGFFILKGHKTLENREISVYQSGDQKSGKTDFLGASLVPLTSGYRQQTHRVDIVDLPAGYDLGAGQVEVFPSYNSGYKITIGTDPAALVIGVLKYTDDSPVALTTGRLVPLGKTETAKKIDFFTNRTGRFVAERVPPGIYQIVLMPGDRFIQEIEIDDGEDGVFRAGSIVIEEE